MTRVTFDFESGTETKLQKMPNKQGTWHLLALAVLLLAVGILFSWMTNKAPVDEAVPLASIRHCGTDKRNVNTPGQALSGYVPQDDAMTDSQTNPRTANKPDAALGSVPAEISIKVRSMSEMQPDPATGCEQRCERRELSMAIHDLFLHTQRTTRPRSILYGA